VDLDQTVVGQKFVGRVLAVTYIVVIFSIIVQALTVTRLAERVGRAPELPHD